MPSALSQARALVTGGASGLGRACAERVARAGGAVAVLDRDQAQGDAVARELGERAVFVRADVRNDAEVQAAVGAAATALGGLTLVVNCAGIVFGARVLGRDGPMPMEAFETAIDINLVGTFRVCRAAAALLRDNPPDAQGQRGVIVNTASIAAFEGQIGQSAYAASKGGVVSLTLPLARELARHGIRVVAIAPGLFHTPFYDALSEDVRAQLTAAIPFPPRAGEPQEFAALVEHVYENPMLNGCVLRIDGALRMPAR